VKRAGDVAQAVEHLSHQEGNTDIKPQYYKKERKQTKAKTDRWKGRKEERKEGKKVYINITQSRF
jgi:hypothetical protein